MSDSHRISLSRKALICAAAPLVIMPSVIILALLVAHFFYDESNLSAPLFGWNSKFGVLAAGIIVSVLAGFILSLGGIILGMRVRMKAKMAGLPIGEATAAIMIGTLLFMVTAFYIVTYLMRVLHG